MALFLDERCVASLLTMDDALGRSSDVDELRNLIQQGGGAAVTRRAASAA